MVYPIITFVAAIAVAFLSFQASAVPTGMEEPEPPAVEESSDDADSDEEANEAEE